MIRHLAAPDRPVLRCESLQQLAVTYNPRPAADDFSPQSALPAPDLIRDSPRRSTRLLAWNQTKLNLTHDSTRGLDLLDNFLTSDSSILEIPRS